MHYSIMTIKAGHQASLYSHANFFFFFFFFFIIIKADQTGL